jgi:hypothetical protein
VKLAGVTPQKPAKFAFSSLTSDKINTVLFLAPTKPEWVERIKLKWRFSNNCFGLTASARSKLLPESNSSTSLKSKLV